MLTLSILLGILTVGICIYTTKFLDSFFLKSLFIIFAFSLGSFVVIAGSNLENQSNSNLSNNTGLDEKIVKAKPIKDKPFTTLIIGTDRDSFDVNSRSDSMMLAVVDPKNKEVNIMSIFRDLYAYLPVQEHYDKINTAYSYGGISSTVAAVENYFDIEIDHYAIVNFNGFVELVNSLDGIKVDVEKDMEHNNKKDPNYAILKEGEQILNGKEALTYSRFRSDDEGDFGRTRRQRQVIQSITNELLNIRNIKNAKGIYDSINNNFESSFSLGEMIKLGYNFMDATSDDIKTFGFKAEPVNYNGISYVEPLEGELENIKEKIRELQKK